VVYKVITTYVKFLHPVYQIWEIVKTGSLLTEFFKKKLKSSKIFGPRSVVTC